MVNILLSIVLTVILLKWITILFGFILSYIVILRESKKESQININEKDTTEEKNNNSIKNNNIKNFIKSMYGKFSGGLIRTQIIFVGEIKSHIIRKFLYKYIFRIGMSKSVVIHRGLDARATHKIKLGNGTIIGDKATLDGRNGIIMGENVNVSTGVSIWTEQHNYNCKNFSCKDKGGLVTVGSYAWISNNVIILPGIRIGEGAVIAAGAVVTKNVDAYSVYGGIPAKKIGDRIKELEYRFNGKPSWFS